MANETYTEAVDVFMEETDLLFDEMLAIYRHFNPDGGFSLDEINAWCETEQARNLTDGLHIIYS